MNTLELIKGILGGGAFLGVLPDKPDKAVALTLYGGTTEAFFDSTAESPNVQARCRAKTDPEARGMAEGVKATLDRYIGQGMVIRQITPVLPIGQDDKGRREYTVNFSITSTGG